MAMTVAARIPPMTPVPMEWRLLAEAPVAMASGTHAEHEGEGGHDDGPQPQPGRLRRGVEQGHALLAVQLDGELDDQDGVLGRQPDQGQQPDLEVDVVVDAAQRDGDQGARGWRRAPPS